MCITGQYFCSYDIKGMPYNKEFKVVLEASVSVYNDLGELQTCIVSKLHSKPIVVKSLIEKNTEQGLELSDVVFGKQCDEYQDFNTCKAMRKYDETLSVKSLLERKLLKKKTIVDRKSQHDLSQWNYVKILQNIRLDSFWINFPNDLNKYDVTGDVKVENINEISPISIIHEKVLPLETKYCVSQQQVIQNEDNAGIEANTYEIKTEHEPSENIKKEDCNQENRVVSVGLPFKRIDNSNCSLATVNVCLESGTLETPDGTVCVSTIDKLAVAKNLNVNIGFDKTLKETCPDRDNFEATEEINDVDNNDGELMMFCADSQRNKIGHFMNANTEDNEVSNTEEQTELSTLPVILDSTYGRLKRTRKATNKRKTNSKAVGCKKDLKSSIEKKTETNDTETILTEGLDAHELEDTVKKIRNIKKSRSNDQKAKRVNVTELIEHDVGQSDVESNDILGPRKRRRCSRNVNYKALADSLDSEESEIEELVSKLEADTVLQDTESQTNEAHSKTKKSTKIVDLDYQPPDLSEMSSDESDEESGDDPSNTKKLKAFADVDYQPSGLSVEESDLNEISSAEENDEETLKQKEKKNKLSKMRVDLEEHKDKFEIVKFISSEQRNRAKPMEEKSHDAFDCKICNTYQTSDKDVMSLHIGQHLKGKLRCKFCKLESSSAKGNSTHMLKEHTTKYMSILTVCEQCGIPFSNSNSRNVHMYKVHKVPAFECQHCLEKDTDNGEKFATLEDLRCHIKERHPRACHQCSYCGKIYVNKKFYKRHKCESKSDETQILKCGDCGNVYESKCDLNTHRRGVHRKEKLCKCTMCDYVAFKSCKVKRHMAHVHLGLYKLFC